MRLLFAALAGSIFGTGLLLSGMTDTVKVQGWLDFFGNWDPALAFVMGGAILPMAVAWRFTPNRQPVLGGAFPGRPSTQLDTKLIGGSVLFGMGWALTGLCPGPALASLSWGGTGGLLFLAAMLAGMWAAPMVRTRLDGVTARGYSSKMDIRPISPAYAVSPQIAPEDMPAIVAAGFKTVLCNRPDAEVPPGLQAAPIGAAAKAAGLRFVENPITHQTLAQTVAPQYAAMAGSDGPVLAYCASGTRSSIVWSLGQAKLQPADAIIAATAKAGYELSGLRAQLDELAKG